VTAFAEFVSTLFVFVLASQGVSLLSAPVFISRASAAAPEVNSASATEQCFKCHSQPGKKLRFQDGTAKSIYIDKAEWMGSIHGNILVCVDCHKGMTPNHALVPKKTRFKNAREYTFERSNTCQHCHYAYYTRFLDSIHYKLQSAGNREAPVCVDCHGSHAMTDPQLPRVEISRKCGRCHTDVYRKYQASVHGQALESDNQDVPVCTDCHAAHAIANPTSGRFHVTSYNLCAKCHSDQKRMKRYNLNPDVLSTYLDDFHGASNRAYAASTGAPQKAIATCTDCHGIHDIKPFMGATASHSRADVRERLVGTCRKCHAEATVSFADAWLSHYPPTLKTAPLVWLVKWFFKIANPTLIALFVLNILLNLWRAGARRTRGSQI